MASWEEGQRGGGATVAGGFLFPHFAVERCDTRRSSLNDEGIILDNLNLPL
jgi:hypothetical protein